MLVPAVKAISIGTFSASRRDNEEVGVMILVAGANGRYVRLVVGSSAHP